MTVNVEGYEDCLRKAVRGFWKERSEAEARAKAEAERRAATIGGPPTTSQGGQRATVISGQHLRGFEELIERITRANGLPNAEVMVGSQLVVLPGFFRPTKRWDVLVMNGNRLVAAFEFKSQVGSVSNNYNNRTEEAIGSARCLATAAREGAFGDECAPPFLGWLMIVDNSKESRHVPKIAETDFKVFEEFEGTSYLDRYDIFCQRLISEKVYNVAAVIATSKDDGGDDGHFIDLSQVRCESKNSGSKAHLGLSHFVTAFAGCVATEAARHPNPPPRAKRPSQIKAEAERAAKEEEKAKKAADKAAKKAEKVAANAGKSGGGRKARTKG